MKAIAQGISRFLGGSPAEQARRRTDEIGRRLAGYLFRHLDRTRLAEALQRLLEEHGEQVQRHGAHEAHHPEGLRLADGIVVVINTDTTAFQARLRMRQLCRHHSVRGLVVVTTAPWADDYRDGFEEDGKAVRVVLASQWQAEPR